MASGKFRRFTHYASLRWPPGQAVTGAVHLALIQFRVQPPAQTSAVF
jgi:hypothetical protein